MASSSTTSIQKSYLYDVFLSFSGEDTRKSFVDHLYNALHQQGIRTFSDDKRLKKGEEIGDELMKAIEDSKFFIIVFSKRYASSSWCLSELVKIMECQKITDQKAFPVFYDVEPTEVRKQSGEFGNSLSKHDQEKVRKWREALEKAANLAGWDLRNIADGHEAEVIKLIVERISLELRSINLCVDENLVGMENRIKEIESSLEIGSDDVRMIGIKGIGGGGKTTLARAVFDHISTHFKAKSFVENVREVSQASLSGLKSLQKQILSDLLSDQGIIINSVYDGKRMMKTRLGDIKVLLVLDDVDDPDQLEVLAGNLSWFKAGSRIIITTRDEQVLASHNVHLYHDVNLLSQEEAICLFCRYAFGTDIPIQGYADLSQKVVDYAAGLPLTLKVLGSFLIGKDKLHWESALKRLETIPERETLKILELSYNGLEYDYKEIFLDVACLLIGWKKNKAIRLLESCGFHARSGLEVLEQKSLIAINYDGVIGMHDRIEEMAKDIVLREHPLEPNKLSRLWMREKIEDIFANESGTEATRCVLFWPEKFSPEFYIKGLGSMKNLRVILLHSELVDPNSNDESDDECPRSDWNVDQAGRYFPNTLRYLKWMCYPYKSLPKTFEANNLVALEMPNSKIKHFWEVGEIKDLNSLTFLDLSSSKLIKLDLGLIPNIEKLNLRSCKKLVELHMPINGCLKLKSLNLDSSKLKTLDLRLTPNLEKLSLNECNELVNIHMPAKGFIELRSLRLHGSEVKTIDIGLCSKLERLTVMNFCDSLENQMPVNGCPYVAITGSKMRALDLRLSPNLKKLHLTGCDKLVEFHMPVRCPELTYLSLENSKLKNIDLRLSSKLTWLLLHECDDLVGLYFPINGCLELTDIDIMGSKLRTLDLQQTPNVVKLRLTQCDELEELRMPINGCQDLNLISLTGSKLKSFDLGLTPDLWSLDICNCHEMAELHFPMNGCLELIVVKIMGSKLSTLDLRQTSAIHKLILTKCHDLEELHLPINGCLKLSYVHFVDLKLSVLDFQLTKNLDTLILIQCEELEELHMPNDGCQNLKFLLLNCSKLKNFDFSLTPDLRMLNICECHDMVGIHLPMNGCPELVALEITGSNSSNLHLSSKINKLTLNECHDLVEIHFPIDGCPNLTDVVITCSTLSMIDLRPAPNLENLHLTKCDELEELHLPINGCLELIDVEITGSKLGILDFQLALKLEKLCLIECNELVELHLPINGCLELTDLKLIGLKLNALDLRLAKNLERLHLENCQFRTFALAGSMLEEPRVLDRLECMEELILLSTKIIHFPDSICLSKHLKSLQLKSCWLLERLPKNLEQLECLENLILTECTSLENIPNSICKMRCLRYFCLSFCIRVEKLPDELGSLKSLQELNVKCTGLSRLPQSISGLKGLRVVGSRSLLQSCAFATEIQTSETQTFCYISHEPTGVPRGQLIL